MIIIGSTALKRILGEDSSYRKPKDLDLICSKEEMNSISPGPLYKGPQWVGNSYYGPAEFLLIEESPAAKAYHEYTQKHYFCKANLLYGPDNVKVAPIEVLYSLKR